VNDLLVQLADAPNYAKAQAVDYAQKRNESEASVYFELGSLGARVQILASQIARALGDDGLADDLDALLRRDP
jgi:hypothetical protein